MSRLKSAPGAKGKAKPGKPAKAGARTARTAAPGGAARGVYVQSPKSDIYVVMLGIALGAILLGCLLLLWLWYGYNMQIKPTVMNPTNGSPSSLMAAISERGTGLLSLRA
jgi:hypothetical protein